MSLRRALVLELHTISPLRRASLVASTFRDYTENVRKVLTYITSLDLETDSASQLDVAVSNYGVFLYDLNPKCGNLQQFRYTIFGIIFLLQEIKTSLSWSKQTKGWDKTVPSNSPLHFP